MHNNPKITLYNVQTSDSNNKSKTYKIKSIVLDDDDFDDKLEELMNQELVFGSTNYY